MKLDLIHRVYFLGIGGIGMSALARWFNAQGLPVSGYDRTRTPLTDQLQKEGISIHFEDNIDQIDKEVIDKPDSTLIIYTPAIPSDHKEFNHLQSLGFGLYKRSEVLGMITAQHFTVAVAGTHGKTSTSSLTAHILKESGINCAAFVGGIMVNYASNLILPKSDSDIVVVVEADEFDRSFLRLNPDLAIVTAADPDHLDIYGDGNHLKDSFREFIAKINRKGKLFIKERVATELELKNSQGIDVGYYDVNEGSIKAEKITVNDGAFVFDYVSPERRIEGLRLSFPGRHNVENTIAAISIALHLGVSEEAISEAVRSYRGVKRRFEHIFQQGSVSYIDDYAHHPEEIRSFLSALRELYPGKKITAIFQPHLFTRTRDFADGFAESLELADEVILIPIYPARELPIEGVNSDLILKKMTEVNVQLLAKEDVVEYVEENDFEVLATIGAGDIDQLVVPIKEVLANKYDSIKS